MDEIDLRDWIGRSHTAKDVLALKPVRALQATLDDPAPPLDEGDPLPPLWHWLYFWEVTPTAELGEEGHTALGRFLPPIDLQRRMWAGSRLSFLRPVLIGTPVTRLSTVKSITEKDGRSGRLVFVTVAHEISDSGGLVIEEEHDIVYRDMPKASDRPEPGETAPPAPPWRKDVVATAVHLFRYSALTFNAHRIHYDHPYTTGPEGYPDLIVHGPLLATLMVDLAAKARPDRFVSGFRFRAKRPIFANAEFTVAGQPESDASAAVWVVDPEGYLAMQGEIAFAGPASP